MLTCQPGLVGCCWPWWQLHRWHTKCREMGTHLAKRFANAMLMQQQCHDLHIGAINVLMQVLDWNCWLLVLNIQITYAPYTLSGQPANLVQPSRRHNKGCPGNMRRA